MRLIAGVIALAGVLPVAAQDAEVPKKPEQVVADARKALEGIEGIRGVSYAGIERKYRLFVTLDREDAFLDVCHALGGEFEGMRVQISKPSKAKPFEPQPQVEPPAPAPPPKLKVEPVTTGPTDEERLDELAKMVYEIGVETIKMYELLECDGIRAALKLPPRDIAKGGKRCEHIQQLKWGFRVGASGGDIVRHRKDCAFDAEQILRILPKEIKRDLEEYAECFRKIEKSKKQEGR